MSNQSPGLLTIAEITGREAKPVKFDPKKKFKMGMKLRSIFIPDGLQVSPLKTVEV